MTQANSVLPKRKPYVKLVSKVQKAVSQSEFTDIDVYSLSAMAVVRSMGLAYFCRCDSLFKSQMKAIEKLGSIHPQVFLGMLKATLGPDKGAISKFSVDWQKYESVKSRESLSYMSGAEMLYYSSRVGLFQMPLWEIVTNAAYFEDNVYLKIYLSDPQVQIRDTARILQGFVRICSGRFEDGLRLFCFQFFEDNSGSVFKRVQEIANMLREHHEESERPGE